MADYYMKENNSTYFLSGSKIRFTEGSGSNSDKTNSTEMTLEWYALQQDVTLINILSASIDVSGSYTYVLDHWSV